MAVVVALAVIGLSGALLVRALKTQVPHRTGAVPTVTPSVTNATPSPAPSAAGPGEAPLPARCDVAVEVRPKLRAGRPDLAVVAHVSCLRTGGNGTASPSPDAGFAISVRWSGGGEGTWPLAECRRICRLVAAPDLDGSGKAEALLAVDGAASARFLEALAMPETEAGPVELGVAPPGAVGFPQDRPARFAWSASATRLGDLTCEPARGASPGPSASTLRVVSSTAVRSTDGTRWTVRETTFRFSFDANRDVSKLLEGPRRVADAFLPVGATTRSFPVGDPRVRAFVAGDAICGVPAAG